jgi:hypothetical protein
VPKQKVKTKNSTVNESESVYKQPGLFEEDNLLVGEEILILKINYYGNNSIIC